MGILASLNTTTARLLSLRVGSAGLLAGAMMLGACSAESLLEKGVTEGIEKTVQEGSDLDDFEFDLDDDGGSFSFTDENGERVELDFDENGANMNATDADGNDIFDIEVDEDGLTATDEQGNEVLTLDEEGLTATDENGNEVLTLDEDGLITLDENGNPTLNLDAGN